MLSDAERQRIEKAKDLADEIAEDRAERPGSWNLGDEVLFDMLSAAYPSIGSQRS